MNLPSICYRVGHAPMGGKAVGLLERIVWKPL